MLLNSLWQNKTARFVVLFFVLYGFFYGINYLLTGLIAPGGYHIAWLQHHADYVTATRDFLLQTTAWVVRNMGFIAHKEGNMLWVENRHAIKMVYSCIGFNLFSMWWAFILAYPMNWVQRLLLFVSGTFLIIALNITRLTILVLKTSPINMFNQNIDHHDLYNLVTYGIILLGIKLVIDHASKETSAIAKANK